MYNFKPTSKLIDDANKILLEINVVLTEEGTKEVLKKAHCDLAHVIDAYQELKQSGVYGLCDCYCHSSKYTVMHMIECCSPRLFTSLIVSE